MFGPDLVTPRKTPTHTRTHTLIGTVWTVCVIESYE